MKSSYTCVLPEVNLPPQGDKLSPGKASFIFNAMDNNNHNQNDSHICGNCETRFDNIEDFIHHKTQTEKQILNLIPSTKIKNLLIPTFTDPSKTSGNIKFTECRKIFTQNFILQVHKPLPKSQTNCNHCGINFKRNKPLLHEFVCRYKNCSYTFKTKGSLKRHERRHTGERPYNCELCGRNFTESGALKRHKQSRILCTSKSDSDLPRYGKRMEDNKLGNIIDGTDNAVLDDLDVGVEQMESEKCQLISVFEFSDIFFTIFLKCFSEFFEHFECFFEHFECFFEYFDVIFEYFDNFSSILDVFRACDICSLTFDSVKELQSHLLRHSGKEYVKCGVCRFVSSDKNDVIEHIENRHEEFSGKTTHEVEVNLIIHDALKTSNETSPNSLQTPTRFNCHICTQIFATNDDLKAHQLNHTTQIKPNNEQYSCLICNKQFPTKSKLRKHAFSHSDQRNFRCSECGKLFKRLNHAQNHIKTTHSVQKPFVCVVCEKRFKSLGSMKAHVKIHDGDLPFVCHVCEKSFREKASLKRHIRTHTGEKPYVCRYCGHGFAEHGTLSLAGVFR
uniref:C2H2-type domain-containing protein n=1 Tax=Strigamia maritima TaxID=126957 RepID=T1JLZ8_STRMM